MGFGKPDAGKPPVRFDEGREADGHWPPGLSIRRFPPTLPRFPRQQVGAHDRQEAPRTQSASDAASPLLCKPVTYQPDAPSAAKSWRISSSTASGASSVWAISAFTNSRKRQRMRCTEWKSLTKIAPRVGLHEARQPLPSLLSSSSRTAYTVAPPPA